MNNDALSLSFLLSGWDSDAFNSQPVSCFSNRGTPMLFRNGSRWMNTDWDQTENIHTLLEKLTLLHILFPGN